MKDPDDKKKSQKGPKDQKPPSARKEGKGGKGGAGKESAEDKAAKKGRSEPQEKLPPSRLAERYRNEIVPLLRSQFGYGNPLQIPRVTKVVVSMGIGKAIENKNRIEHAVRDLATISGQKPVVTKSKQAISSFRLRQAVPIGAMVTLRRQKMYEFLDRLISVVIPRIKDFRGLNRKMDGRGNYSMGLSEQVVFPEINLDKIEFVQGMNITMVTTASTDEEGIALLEKMGLPFKK
jgi:large subunit ribosomal protein L5